MRENIPRRLFHTVSAKHDIKPENRKKRVLYGFRFECASSNQCSHGNNQWHLLTSGMEPKIEIEFLRIIHNILRSYCITLIVHQFEKYGYPLSLRRFLCFLLTYSDYEQNRKQQQNCATYMTRMRGKWRLLVKVKRHESIQHQSVAQSLYHNVALSGGKKNKARPLDGKTPSSLTWVNTASAVTAGIAM